MKGSPGTPEKRLQMNKRGSSVWGLVPHEVVQAEKQGKTLVPPGPVDEDSMAVRTSRTSLRCIPLEPQGRH